jgi:hypothetical protein
MCVQVKRRAVMCSGMSQEYTFIESKQLTAMAIFSCPALPVLQAEASEQLGIQLPREKFKHAYNKALVERYKHLPEIKRVHRHRHLPAVSQCARGATEQEPGRMFWRLHS